MKTLMGIILSGLFLITTATFADDSNSNKSNNAKTSLHSNWYCTTNASSSDKKEDKAADKIMSDRSSSAAKSFAFAAKHCRDCTEITCKINK